MDNQKLANLYQECIIIPMSLELNETNMKLFFPSSLKPLENQEIIDFLETPYQEEPRLWFPQWEKDLEKPKKLPVDNRQIVKYTTKKSIRQAISLINDQLELWLVHKQAAPNEITKEFAEIHLEELFKEKEKLQGRLRYTGVKFSNDRLMQAKQVPLGNFLKFNSAGFASCLWHSEKTPSLHKITGKNKVYCFAGCGTKDVIDVVQNLNNCDLPSALKIILG